MESSTKHSDSELTRGDRDARRRPPVPTDLPKAHDQTSCTFPRAASVIQDTNHPTCLEGSPARQPRAQPACSDRPYVIKDLKTRW